MYFDEGFEVSAAKYYEDETIRKAVQSKSQSNLVLVGNYKQKGADDAFFEEISQHCSTSTKELKLRWMDHTLPANKLKVFPILKKLTFHGGVLSNDAILQFKNWCPNLTELRFVGRFTMEEDAYELFTSTDVTFPRIKTFAFSFEDISSDDFEMTREFLAMIDAKFPKLESLELNLATGGSYVKYNLPYEPLYFRNLKKLSVLNYAERIDGLFDYMAVSNTKLKELRFEGMTQLSESTRWIASCNQLTKLTLDCPCLSENSLMDLKNMASLSKVKLSAKYLDWEPAEIIEFVRNNPQVTLLDIDSDRKNDDMKFEEDFREKFYKLVQRGRQLVIQVLFHQGHRVIKISNKEFSEKYIFHFLFP